MSQIEIRKEHYIDKETQKWEKSPGGVEMTFDNGNSILFKWGMHDKCSSTPALGEPTLICTSAEVMICDEDDNFVIFDMDIKKGWVTHDEVAQLIYITSNNTIEEIQEIVKLDFSEVK